MHFRYVNCSVTACTDVFIWMQDGVGAGLSPSAHLWGRILGSSDSVAKIASSKNDIRLLRPSTHHRRRSSNALRRSGSAVNTQSSWPPLFWLPENCNMGTGVRLVQNSLFGSKTHFLRQIFQNQAVIRDHRKVNILLFCPF